MGRVLRLNCNNRSPYHLRPRPKVVRAIHQKTALTRLENSRSNKKIAEQAKLPFDEIEAPGERFPTMTQKELKKYIRDQKEASGIVYKPPKRCSDEEQAKFCEEKNLQLAETALLYLNTTSNLESTYELVKPLVGNFFLSYKDVPIGVFHSNFEAKLQNNPEAPVELFFVEIVEKVPGKPNAIHCCSLGPSGSETAATGLNGCRACSIINHPKNKSVRFIKR